MRIKFTNGTMKHCAPPTEQKVFKNIGGEQSATGWVLLMRLTDEITSSEIDELMTPENVKRLEFYPEEESKDAGETPLFTLDGYSKITSSSIRYAETPGDTSAEIQMSKGL